MLRNCIEYCKCTCKRALLCDVARVYLDTVDPKGMVVLENNPGIKRPLPQTARTCPERRKARDESSIKGTYVEEKHLNDADKIDYRSLKPVLFEFPTYEYLKTGEVLGKCLSFKKNPNE